MKYEPEEIYMDAILSTARRMCAAAQTAPKGHGVDSIVTYILTGGEKEQLACEMERPGTEYMGGKMPTWYGRDANCVRKAGAVVVIGAKHMRRGMSRCGICGFENCAANAAAGGRCADTFIDLGIAIGSAVSVAGDDRIDNRIMFSIAQTLRHMPEYGPDYAWFGIPLSVSSKNIFMDRGITHRL